VNNPDLSYHPILQPAPHITSSLHNPHTIYLQPTPLTHISHPQSIPLFLAPPSRRPDLSVSQFQLAHPVLSPRGSELMSLSKVRRSSQRASLGKCHISVISRTCPPTSTIVTKPALEPHTVLSQCMSLISSAFYVYWINDYYRISFEVYITIQVRTVRCGKKHLPGHQHLYISLSPPLRQNAKYNTVD